MQTTESKTNQIKAQRATKINELIRCIGGCGRQFFFSKENNRFAVIEVDPRGRVWWIDDGSGRRIYTHYRGDWRGFSHGGTLQALVIAFREYICTGEPINPGYFGPWPDWVCGSDLWGYGVDIQVVREKAKALSVIVTEI
jgi:hypothetical protein